MNSLIFIKDLNFSLVSKDKFRKTIIRNLSLKIPNNEKGSINSIIAPFGSGKTTLLKLIAGLKKYDSGSLEIINENKAVPLIPENNPNLPWLNVEENIRLWKNIKNEKISDLDLAQILNDVGLSNYNKFYPQNINSGFQFRIALARTLTLSPKIILIDDSFKQFDAETRNEIYSVLNQVKDKYKIHFILATTNLIEALYLSDNIFLMSKNPAQIIFETKIKEKFNSIDNMLNSQFFKLLSEEIQMHFKKSSGITLIHYSV